jgi:hypothetical protein
MFLRITHEAGHESPPGSNSDPRSKASSSHAVGFEFSGLAEIGAQLDDKIDSVTRTITRNPVPAQ